MKTRLYAMHRIAAALLLLIFFGLSFGSILHKSPTFDEGFYISRGWAFWRTGRLLILGHPPLNDLLAGLGVLFEPGLPAPQSLAGWTDGDSLLFSRDLLWGQGVNASRVILLARMPFIWLGMLLGAVVWRWGRDMYGGWSGMVALALFALSPNIIAHTRLAATDLGVAAFYVATLYAWSTFLQRRTLRWLIASGVVFGLAQASKFSALLLIPTLGLMTLWFAWQARDLTVEGSSFVARVSRSFGRSKAGWLWNTFLTLVVMGLIGVVVLWAAHLFTLRPFADDMYFGQFNHFLTEAEDGHRAYLLGRFSQNGWWYYHLITLGVKLPLPTIILFILAVIFAIGRRMRPNEWMIVFPGLLFLGFSLLSSLNVGIRYLLPILPLLFLFCSRLASGPRRSGWLRPSVLGTVIVSLLVVNARTYPNYIPFFNLIAGGPRNGYRVLADSNVDWGQDLPALVDYLAQRGSSRVFLSYFGQADPAYYGIDYVALPAWPPEPDRPDFHPMNPEPGLYAISISNLLGLQLYETESFGYFRTRQPAAVIGNSIHVYEVFPEDYIPTDVPEIADDNLPNGEDPAETHIIQCLPPDDVEAQNAIQDLTGHKQLHLVYVRCEENIPYYPNPGWLLLPANLDPVVNPGTLTYQKRFEDGQLAYNAWLLEEVPTPTQTAIDFPNVSLPLPIAGHIELLGYEVSSGQVQPGEDLVLRVWWRVRNPPNPGISLFAHLLRPDGSLAQGADGLGVVVEEWEPDLVFIQQHTFLIDETFEPGDYTLATGMYSTVTGERFAVSQSADRVVDRVVLRVVEVREN